MAEIGVEVLRKFFFVILPFCFIGFGASAQKFLSDSLESSCHFSITSEDEVYQFESETDIIEAVAKILNIANTTKNFFFIRSNVPKMTAAIVNGERYVLCPMDFFSSIDDESRDFFILAHAVGHHLLGHSFEASNMEREESEADQFAGYILFNIGGIVFQDVKAELSSPVYSSEKANNGLNLNDTVRLRSYETGWKRAEAFVQVNSTLGYDENDPFLNKLPIPQFPWPPPDCSQRRRLSDSLNRDFVFFSQIDGKIQRALDDKGYYQRSYFQTPGGFAIVTQLEQMNPDASSKSSKSRWVDYPVQESFSGILDYLSSLIRPNPGFFRLFVFIVSDSEYRHDSRKISKEEAMSWLTLGFNRLPGEIGRQKITDDHYLEVLIYEFEAPQTTKICKIKCPTSIEILIHLEKSGLNSLGF